MNYLHRRINSWMAVVLFMSMTIWVFAFYFIETRKLFNNDFNPDYNIYYEIVKN